MKSGSSLMPEGLAGKIIRFAVAFVIVMGILFMAIFGAHLANLRDMLISQEKQQREIISEKTKESLTNITEENLNSLIVSAVERTNDEFKIVKQDLISLRSQVEDVFRHPENYQPKEISIPDRRNGDKPVLQLLAPDGYENISPETYEMMQRLANLEPVMREIVLSEDYIIDSYISMLDGVTLSFDRLSAAKFEEDGTIKKYDARERAWFKGALETKDVFFSSTLKSSLYGFNEVVYSAPVYAEGKPVAVLEGCLHVEGMSEFINGSEREIGASGFSVLISREGQLSSSPREEGELMLDKDINTDIRDSVNPELKAVIDRGLSGETGVEIVPVDGEEYYAAYGYIPVSGWMQVIFVSVPEATEPVGNLNRAIEKNSEQIITKESRIFTTTIVIALIALVVIITVSNYIVSRSAKKRVKPVAHMTDSLRGITGVNMFFEMEDIYRTGDEIEVLAESFETMAEKLRSYVDEIIDDISGKERARTEFALAARIQADLLPNSFPAFPDRKEFNIHASMTPAKEVGGDFYDFFFVGKDQLAMVMADVSGKGVPAAMFMMMAKSMIQNELMVKKDPGKVLEDVNNMICANNREKMFVTVWIGILDLSTGILTASNAGHEYPIFKNPEEPFEIIKDKHGFVIGGKKNMKYTNYELVMRPGAKLFVYTDGVPEAMNEDGKLFGMERTLEAVNKKADASAKGILECVESEIKDYVGSAEQFDDLTMLCIEYFGNDATAANMDE